MTSLIANLSPDITAWVVVALAYLGFVIVSKRLATARYNASMARIQDSIKIQNEAIALQKQANLLLQEIRDSLRDQ